VMLIRLPFVWYDTRRIGITVKIVSYHASIVNHLTEARILTYDDIALFNQSIKDETTWILFWIG